MQATSAFQASSPKGKEQWMLSISFHENTEAAAKKISYSFIYIKPLLLPPEFADVAKLADALDLGSSAARRVGSTPSIRTW